MHDPHARRQLSLSGDLPRISIGVGKLHSDVDGERGDIGVNRGYEHQSCLPRRMCRQRKQGDRAVRR